MIRHVTQHQVEQAQHGLQLGLTADEASASREPGPLEYLRLFSGLLSYTPSADEILATYVRNFTGRGIPKSRPVRPLTLEIVLSPQQSAAGGHLPIRVPVFDVCEQCQGTGQDGFFTCDQCAGRGITERFHEIDVLIPAKLKQEMLIPISLRNIGASGTYLNVRVRPSQFNS